MPTLSLARILKILIDRHSRDKPDALTAASAFQAERLNASVPHQRVKAAPRDFSILHSLSGRHPIT